MEKIYTKKEAAELLRISVRTLNDRMATDPRRGGIRFYREGHKVRFRGSYLKEYIERRAPLIQK